MSTRREHDEDDDDPKTGWGVIYRWGAKLDPICLLALIFACLSFALVLDCRRRQGELDELHRPAAHESYEGERAADRSEEQNRDVHVVDVGP